LAQSFERLFNAWVAIFSEQADSFKHTEYHL